jgi:hypothetical protein
LSADRFESAIARSERTLLLVIFAAATLLQINGILHHGYMGQDWSSNADSAAQAVRMPPPRWIVYVGTNPPALYWLAALVQYVTGSTAYIAATSFMFVVLNTGALFIWARLARTAIRQPTLRVAALLTLAFLPLRLIHTTVFACDAIVVLPFTLVVWLSYELFRADDPRQQIKLAVALSVALLVGLCSKITMASAVPIMFLLLLVHRRSFLSQGSTPSSTTSSRKILICALLLLVVVPGIFVVDYYYIYSHLPAADTRRVAWRHDMEWRSLLMLRAADVEMLRAPQYLDQISLGGAQVFNLLVINRHSYAGLLHLSMFTDALNIFQSDPTDSYFGARDALHQGLMTVAVCAAVPLSVLMIGATGAHLLRLPAFLRGLRGPRDAESGKRLLVMIVLGLSVAFFANIAVFLPFVKDMYNGGYWTARLVMPPLLGFCFLGFALLDDWLSSGAARAAVFAYAVAQATLHASFLWVRGP